MNSFLKKIIGDKKEWWSMEARAKALPSDYRIVYDAIKGYMFMLSSGDGMDTITILKDLLELFETGAADGKRALEVTGEDVAAFCDELLRNAKTLTENWRETMNRDVMKKLRSEERKSDE
jgi:DNA-binding ferritin-like protein (Dps family)